jgi:hypothetical protein
VVHTTRKLVLETGKFGHLIVELVAGPRKIVGDIGKVGCKVGIGLAEAEDIAFGLVSATTIVHV